MEKDIAEKSESSNVHPQSISLIDQILQDIDAMVDNPKKWCFGLCANPKRRSQQLGDPPQWRHWNAKNHMAALAIAENLAARGLRNVSNGDLLPSYVHIHAAAAR